MILLNNGRSTNCVIFSDFDFFLKGLNILCQKTFESVCIYLRWAVLYSYVDYMFVCFHSSALV